METNTYAEALSLKNYRDMFSVIDTAKKDGKMEEKIETAIKMAKKGMSIEDISDITGLSIEEIKRILEKHKK